MFTKEDVVAAQAIKATILAGDVSELKSIFMAGQICMWEDMRPKEHHQGPIIRELSPIRRCDYCGFDYRGYDTCPECNPD